MSKISGKARVAGKIRDIVLNILEGRLEVPIKNGDSLKLLAPWVRGFSEVRLCNKSGAMSANNLDNLYFAGFVQIEQPAPEGMASLFSTEPPESLVALFKPAHHSRLVFESDFLPLNPHLKEALFHVEKGTSLNVSIPSLGITLYSFGLQNTYIHAQTPKSFDVDILRRSLSILLRRRVDLRATQLNQKLEINLSKPMGSLIMDPLVHPGRFSETLEKLIAALSHDKNKYHYFVEACALEGLIEIRIICALIQMERIDGASSLDKSILSQKFGWDHQMSEFLIRFRGDLVHMASSAPKASEMAEVHLRKHNRLKENSSLSSLLRKPQSHGHIYMMLIDEISLYLANDIGIKPHWVEKISG